MNRRTLDRIEDEIARQSIEPCRRGERCVWLKTDGVKGVFTAGGCVVRDGWAADKRK